MQSPSGDEWLAPFWLLVATGATLPYVWKIPLAVGTLLNAMNLGPLLFDGVNARVAVTAGANYLVPYIVSSLGFLRCQRQTAAYEASAIGGGR